MEITSLSTKGQIVLPKKIRDAMKLKPGVKLTVSLDGNRIVLTPYTAKVAENLYGMYQDTDLLNDLVKEHQNELTEDNGIER